MCASQYDPTSGYVLNFDDCDDSDATVNPDKYWYVDSDLVGFGNDAINFQSCEAPFGYIEQNGDCDDTQPIVFPGATELCNGILDNCNTTTGLMNGIPSNEYDADLDGFVECGLDVATNVFVPSTTDPSYVVLGGNDCDDTDQFAYPDSPELCNGAYEDCNDSNYDALGAPSTETDDDGDFYV